MLVGLASSLMSAKSRMSPADYRPWLESALRALLREGQVWPPAFCTALLLGEEGEDSEDEVRDEALLQQQVSVAPHPAACITCPAQAMDSAWYRPGLAHPAVIQHLSFSSVQLSPFLPKRPLVKPLAERMASWALTGRFPLGRGPEGKLPVIAGFQYLVNEERLARVYALGPALTNTVACDLSLSAREDALREACQKLGTRGVLSLLGLICTVGSIEALPPTARQLQASFQARHHDKLHSLLTAGARAFAKHAHRGADGWWGRVQGGDLDKNRAADHALMFLLRHACWVNLHLLPHDVATFEVRVEGGYGARWSGDGLAFRGFLEPPMENGHETGWRH
eukprot:gb/GEZN01007599.1/.p1 GENE.gb/GEZN01007599.1/~~gb/GEZN01007599.1/.p1  ORF type:complete len:338 (+),score=24.94 gb/GEZN01007599.1/:159-1172(+)